MENVRYGLLSWKTGNVGNEIQNLAALQFLPRVDVHLDADNLHKVRSRNKIKLIMNGWFSHKPPNWPPSEDIEPLFISFHISKNAIEEFTSPSSIAYFKRHQPIGCRDTYTQRILEEKGVQSYFSGCLTLTLQRPVQERGDEIVLADLDEDAEKALAKEVRTQAIRTNHWGYPQYAKKTTILLPPSLKPIVRRLGLDTLVWSFLNRTQEEAKFKKAQALLETYAGARLVLTSRLHCALPCLAFNTPVLFVNKNLNDPRFSGLLQYLRAYSVDDFKKRHTEIDWRRPLPNPRDITLLQEELRRRCKEFIGD